jgi:hypothetical protein
MKTIEETKVYFESIGACEDAREWATGKTAKEAWDECPRGDWLLWWARKENVDKRVLTLAKGRCAETVIHLMKDQRSKDAVKAAIDYGHGLITDEQLMAAYAAAYAAAAYAADAYAAAAAAAYAADAAAAAAADAAADDADARKKAREDNQKKTAEIVRSIINPNFL